MKFLLGFLMLTAFILAIHGDAKVEQDSGLAQDYVSTLLENENQFKRKLHKILYYMKLWRHLINVAILGTF